MLNVRGRSDYFLKAEIIKKVIAIGILVATLPWGVKILCWGLVLYSFCDMAIIIYYTKKVLPTGFSEQIKNIFPSLSLSVFTGGIAYGVISLVQSPALQILTGAATGILLYCTLAKLLHFRELFLILKIVKNRSL